ncbi:MAG TPA: hypothetical protein VGQ40_02315 [Chthoniobacterales bacterium]|nr:hypothetical protein [Chthoniobacterales bacterium]
MKKQIYPAATMLMLIGILAVTAKAQSVNGVSIRANIPFEFSVGDKLLPAGEYRIQQVNPSSDVAMLQIANANGEARVLVRVQSMRARVTNRTALVFNRSGSNYFLSTLAIEGSGDAWQAPKSHAERSVGRELAALRINGEKVAVLAR